MHAMKRRTEQEEYSLLSEDAEYRKQMKCDHVWTTVMENSRCYSWCKFCKVTPFAQRLYDDSKYLGPRAR